MDIGRFISQIDTCFNRNDIKGARECSKFWEQEAREEKDDRALLAVLNEQMGIYRREKRKQKSLSICEECLFLIEKLGIQDSVSGATIMVNVATTKSFFKQEEDALKLYDRAAEIYENSKKTFCYEYASLLNNRAGTLRALKRYDLAEKNWFKAVEILKEEGNHDSDVAISLSMLALMAYETDPTAVGKITMLLDEAWDCLNSERIIRDGNYAYAMKKCAPIFAYFRREIEAQALNETADEIYGKKFEV